jgi:hypothetical protein
MELTATKKAMLQIWNPWELVNTRSFSKDNVEISVSRVAQVDLASICEDINYGRNKKTIKHRINKINNIKSET